MTRSIPVVTVVSWTTASLSPRRMPCARRPVTVAPQQRALARLRVAPRVSLREVVTGYKDVSTDSEQAQMSAVDTATAGTTAAVTAVAASTAAVTTTAVTITAGTGMCKAGFDRQRAL